MVFVVFRLVGDAEDRLFKNIILEPQISRVDLLNRIEHVTKIPIEFQQIKYRGNELPDSLNPLESIKEFEELTVKHSSLPEWEVFLLASDIPKNRPHTAKKKQVLEASHVLQRLFTEGFFSSYAGFAIRRIKFIQEFSEYIDDYDEFIRIAVERYFSALFEKNPANPILSFNYSEKSIVGIQAGFICNVSCGGTLQRFYVKGHSAMSSHQNVDMREIFMYLLLAQIGVGPSVHIIPNIHTSVIGVNIATLEVVNFKPSHTTKLTLKAELMLDMIKRLFNVSDLHCDNYGLDINGNLSIVDFRISGSSFDPKNRNVWRNYKQQPEKLKIIREILKGWNLSKAIHDADDLFNDTKEFLKNRNISCMASQRYARYFDSINQNVADCIHDCVE
ncbi:unnamed protein product [Auanema sp. JU1783]|nr:unnamed protein product [Auanema sp. JU1783]